jgi:outer membrane protein TolC
MSLFLMFAFIPLMQAQTISLSQCIDSVQSHSYILRAEKFNTDAAAKSVEIRHADYLPSISGNVGAEGRFLGSDQYSFGQQWTMIHGDWSLGNLISKTEDIAKQKLITATLKQEKARIDGISRVTSLYMNILQKQKQLELLKERISFLEKHKAVAQSLWKAGVKTRLDVLQTETEISITEEEKVRTDMEIRNSVQELARLTGFDEDKITLENIDSGSLVNNADSVSFDATLVSGNPMYRILESQIQTQQLRINDVEARQWPHVFVGGGYFIDGDPTADGNFWSLQTGITIPIYQWKSIRNEKSQVMLMSEAKSMELQDLERELTIHVTKTVTRLNDLKRILDVAQKRLKTLEESLELAGLNYKAGWITNLEYLAVQQQVTKNMIRIEAVRLEYILNLIEYYLTTNQVDKIKAMETPVMQ